MRRLLALLAATAVVLAACGGSGDDDGGQPPNTTAPPVFHAPLTGLRVPSAELVNGPAVSVKIDSSPEARGHQAGLDVADVVFEERVEGGIVRFIAVFHSTDAAAVGPIRSVRSTDPPVVTPIGGVFAYSGGIPAFVSLLKQAPVTAIAEDDGIDALTLRDNRQRPLKTYSSTEKLRSFASTGPGTKAPPALFEFVPEGQPVAPPGGGPAGATPATRLDLAISQRTSATFEYDAATRRWLRSTNGTPHTVEGGARLGAANVVVQFVEYRNTGQRDASGAQVDEGVVVGSGEAWILSEGVLVKGRWSKATNAAVTTYTDAAGAPIRLARGQTWVTLAATGSPATPA